MPDGWEERTNRLRQRRDSLLGPAYRLFYEQPLEIVRGEGVYLYDRQGRAYLDAYNNVPCVGHCHPHVVEALVRQATTLNTHTRYLHEAILEFAEMLLALFPPSLDRVMFTCTGSEANDLALRVANAVTGGTGIIITENAYHGVTAQLAAISPSLGRGIERGAHVFTIKSPDTSLSRAALSRAFSADVTAQLEIMRERGIRPAALIVDTIFASDGILPGEPGFLADAVNAMRKAGGLFIADEVQAGLGRLGSEFWGFARHGIVPDLVSLGKPLGSGHPVAALVARADCLDEFGRRSRYFNTFGGNPVSARVGIAVLEVIRNGRLAEHAEFVGTDLREKLQLLQQRHPAIGEVRGCGLYVGMELVTPEIRSYPDASLATRLVNGLCKGGILTGLCGLNGNVLKIRPPLPISSTEADRIVQSIDEVLTLATRSARSTV